MKWLIDEKGLMPDIKAVDGRSPLYYARNTVQPSPTLYYLVAKKRAPLDIEDDDYPTLVRYAVAAGNLDIVKWLVDKGPTQNADTENRELLNAAAFYEHLHIIKWLVEEKGMLPDILECQNFIPLHIAARKGHFDIVKWLIDEKGVPPDITTIHGHTPMDYAITGESLDIAQWLADKKGGRSALVR